jgi:hypothetical protein
MTAACSNALGELFLEIFTSAQSRAARINAAVRRNWQVRQNRQSCPTAADIAGQPLKGNDRLGAISPRQPNRGRSSASHVSRPDCRF